MMAQRMGREDGSKLHHHRPHNNRLPPTSTTGVAEAAVVAIPTVAAAAWPVNKRRRRADLEPTFGEVGRLADVQALEVTLVRVYVELTPRDLPRPRARAVPSCKYAHAQRGGVEKERGSTHFTVSRQLHPE
jgi:hypothetical protein